MFVKTGGGMFSLAHQVDDGDIAFVIRAMFSPFDIVQDKKKFGRQGILYAIDPVVNLSTVNYILHGLLRFGFDKTHQHWATLWSVLQLDDSIPRIFNEPISVVMTQLSNLANNPQFPRTVANKLYNNLAEVRESLQKLRRQVATHIIRYVITPFGVPRGSEKQGGQHQGVVNRAVTWPVDFVTAMIVDGRCINLMNFWRNTDFSSGSDLGLHLVDMSHTDYVLSHHPKCFKRFNFPQLGHSDKIPQLVPGVISPMSESQDVRKAVWEHGYWHIARSQVPMQKYDNSGGVCNGAHSLTTGSLILCTFAPVWREGLELAEPSAEAGSTFAMDLSDKTVDERRSYQDGDLSLENFYKRKRESDMTSVQIRAMAAAAAVAPPLPVPEHRAGHGAVLLAPIAPPAWEDGMPPLSLADAGPIASAANLNSAVQSMLGYSVADETAACGSARMEMADMATVDLDTDLGIMQEFEDALNNPATQKKPRKSGTAGPVSNATGAASAGATKPLKKVPAQLL